jgi:hypothetical protein
VLIGFASSNPAEDNGLSRKIQIRSTTSFGTEVKTAVSCRKISRHVTDPYNTRQLRQNSLTFLAYFLLLLYQVSAGYYQRTLVGESGMIYNSDGEAQEISNGRSVRDAICDTIP